MSQIKWIRKLGLRKRQLHQLVLMALVLMTAGTAFASRTQAKLYYSYKFTEQRVDGPVDIGFSAELDPGFTPEIYPKADGKWAYHQGWFGIDSLQFVPDSPLEASRRYLVTLTNVRRMSGQDLPNQILAFSTEKAAAVESFEPKDGASQVGILPKLTLRLASPNHSLRRPVLRLEPNVEVGTPTVSEDRIFTWQPKSDLQQDTTYHVFVDDQNVGTNQNLVTTSFTTVTPPRIVSATSGGGQYPNFKIAVEFDQPMVQTDQIFHFGLKGSGQWVNDHRYEYTTSEYQPGTTYDYSVLKGAKTMAGGVLAADANYQVSTLGAVTASISPSGSGIGINSTVNVYFDQPVDHASAQSKFSVTPTVSGSFGWSGNTMIFSHTAFDYQSSYQFVEGAGVKSVYGLDSAVDFHSNITTEIKTTKLNVPLYKQAYKASCEAASLRMVLAYYGIGSSDYDINVRAGYSPRSRDTGNNSWDDPYTMFVGDMDGVQNSTGYGVYSGPIASVARSYGRAATSSSGVSAGYIASQIIAGRPVIVWGWSNRAIYDSWSAPGGTVGAWIGEHTRVVTGVYGNASSPIGFYINDPGYGISYYWSAQQLMDNMNVFGNLSNQAVVVD